MSLLRAEVRKMISLGAPVAAAQLSTMLLGFVDTVMVGWVSVEAIAASALANVWIFGTMMFAAGVLFGMDPVVAQAHGAGDGARARPALLFNALGYWLLGLPLGSYLALRAGWGLAGIWWGLCCGLFVVASLLVLSVRLRGPAASGAAPLR